MAVPESPLAECNDEIIARTLDAATKVHRVLGPGLLESIYEKVLCLELEKRGLKYQSQVQVRVNYEGHNLGVGFRADVIVEASLVLEIKSVKEIQAIHISQLMTYQRLLKIKRGYILNFNRPLMKEGIKRISI